MAKQVKYQDDGRSGACKHCGFRRESHCQNHQHRCCPERCSEKAEVTMGIDQPKNDIPNRKLEPIDIKRDCDHKPKDFQDHVVLKSGNELRLQHRGGGTYEVNAGVGVEFVLPSTKVGREIRVRQEERGEWRMFEGEVEVPLGMPNHDGLFENPLERARREALERTRSTAENELAKMGSTPEHEEFEALEEERDELQTKVANLQDEVGVLRHNVLEARQQRNERHDRVKALEEMVSKLRDERDVAHSGFEQLSREVLAARGQRPTMGQVQVSDGEGGLVVRDCSTLPDPHVLVERIDRVQSDNAQLGLTLRRRTNTLLAILAALVAAGYLRPLF